MFFKFIVKFKNILSKKVIELIWLKFENWRDKDSTFEAGKIDNDKIDDDKK